MRLPDRRALRTAAALALLGGLALLLASVSGRARLESADLVINNGAEVSTLDPATVTGVPEGRVMYALFEGLTVKDPRTLEPLPGAAERWDVSPDGLTYTFHLRGDARWSNGDPLTAHDFAWSWRRVLAPETASEYAYQLWHLRGGRQYTALPDDRLYGGWIQGQWVQRRPQGRLRVGLHGFFLERHGDPDAPFELLVEPGDHVLRGEPLLRTSRLVVPALVSGRVLALNPRLPRTLGEAAEDPYDTRFLFDLQPGAGALDAVLTDGELLAPAVAREQLFWPWVGVRAEDERTLMVTLEAPTPYFLHLTSLYTLFPVHRATLERFQRESPGRWQTEWVRPENIVTNGPFQLVERRVNDRIRLRKNPNYWDADDVAMRTVDILAVEHYVTMLNMYLTGEIDWIDRCAPNLIPRLLPREDFDPRPYLGTYFYRVNVERPPLDDARVRRALALTIDRAAICAKILKKGERPSWSLCPLGLDGYARPEMEHTPYADAEGYAEAFAADCRRAKELLAEAGYGPPDAGLRRFPTIEIHYNTAEVHRDVAEVVADSWRRRLGIDAKLVNQEWKVYLDTQNTLDFDVSRSSWIGDYPDPNTFVELFVSDGANNRTGWSSTRYDELVRRAGHEPDAAERMALLARAEAILLEELPILPVYSYVSQNLVNPRLGGFHENVQDVHYPKFFYWMDDRELAARRAEQPADRQVVPAPGPRGGLASPNALR